MKDKYLVINKAGRVLDPKKYLKSKECSEAFKILIKREALDEGVDRGVVNCAEKPKYLSYANKLGFDWEQNADVGFVNYDFRANLIKRLVQDYSRLLVNKIGFPIYEISGSNVFSMEHPVVEAYAKLYGDRLFQFESGGKKVVMSYDASYPQFNLAGRYQLSYRNLPMAHFSVSDCYRHEQSGECMLFYRQRRFYMPDLHPYFKDVAEAFKWYPQIEAQLVGAAKEVSRKYEVVAEVASPENWEKYQDEIKQIAVRLGQDVLVGIHRDGKSRYWIINVDYKIIDKLEQSREIGCIQIDVDNARRLGINYIDKDGKEHHPIIIHAAVPGGIERYLYMLFDNFSESFPLWLYPVQIRLIPVGEKYIHECLKIVNAYKDRLIRFEIDDMADSVGKRIKKAHEDLVPFAVVIGKKEKGGVSDELEKAVSAIEKSSIDKPYLSLDWPVLLSRQVK